MKYIAAVGSLVITLLSAALVISAAATQGDLDRMANSVVAINALVFENTKAIGNLKAAITVLSAKFPDPVKGRYSMADPAGKLIPD